jgi:hypothetical protein
MNVGRCDKCFGTVTVPNVWHGIYPPVPTCSECGATAKNKDPVIEMNPAPVPFDKRKSWT